MRSGLAAAWMLAAAGTGWAQAPSTVRFDSSDGTALVARLFQPAGAVRGTVVALHGCGGLYATQGPRAGQLSARHQAMADLLVRQGYAVLMPDSLTPRGETELCTQRTGQRRIGQTQRRADTLAALAWVGKQPWAQSGRVALLGWSHGGSAVLSATDHSRMDVRAQPLQPAVAVAFYPGCTAALTAGYKPSAPLTMMVGELDDWTPAAPCIELGRKVGAEVNVYPGAYHDFDSPVGQVRVRREVPNGVNPGQGVHVGPNPAAREASYKRLLEVLQQGMK